MQSRLLFVRKILVNTFDAKVYSKRQYRCDAHMNELPVPCTPWGPWYKDRQDFYNRVLVAGFAWWAFSFGLAIYTGALYLNWGPPPQPGPPSDMIEECDDLDS